jgi:hypothetical protein
MNYRFKIGPAIIHIDAESEPHDLEDTWSFYWSFLDRSETPPSLRLRLRQSAPAPQANAPLLGELADDWRVYDEGTRYRLEVIDPVGLQPKQIAFFSRDWSEADVHQIPLTYDAPPRLRSGWVVCDLMEPLVQWWMSTWLAERETGFVVHASSVALEEQGLVFVGESGAGKSTIAQFALEKGGVVLNDERSLIWKDGQTWHVSGTPWHGEFAEVSAQPYPLHSFFYLQKAAEEDIVPVSAAAAMAVILPQMFMPLWNSKYTETLLVLLQQLLEDVYNGELRFRKSPAVIDFLRTRLHSRVPA